VVTLEPSPYIWIRGGWGRREDFLKRTRTREEKKRESLEKSMENRKKENK
jgi:hypothetical protein